MTQAPQPNESVRRIMTAAAQLIAGRDGNPEGDAFNAELMLIVGGDLGSLGSMWLAGMARENRRHVVHLRFSPDNPLLPIVTFAHREGNVVSVYEDCLLWAANDHEPVRILRIDYGVAFQMSKKHRMRRRPAPVTSFEAGVEGMHRAIDRLYRIAEDAEVGLLCTPIGLRLRGKIN